MLPQETCEGHHSRFKRWRSFVVHVGVDVFLDACVVERREEGEGEG